MRLVAFYIRNLNQAERNCPVHGLHSVTAPFLAEGQSISIDYAFKAFVDCETELLAVMKVLKL